MRRMLQKYTVGGRMIQKYTAGSGYGQVKAEVGEEREVNGVGRRAGSGGAVNDHVQFGTLGEAADVL